MILLLSGFFLGLAATAPGALLVLLMLTPVRRWERLWILCYASVPLVVLFGLAVQLGLTIAALPPGLSTPGELSHALPATLAYGACPAAGGFFSAAVGVFLGNALRRRLARRDEILAARARR